MFHPDESDGIFWKIWYFYSKIKILMMMTTMMDCFWKIWFFTRKFLIDFTGDDDDDDDQKMVMI